MAWGRNGFFVTNRKPRRFSRIWRRFDGPVVFYRRTQRAQRTGLGGFFGDGVAGRFFEGGWTDRESSARPTGPMRRLQWGELKTRGPYGEEAFTFSSDPSAALRSFASFCLKNTSSSNLRQIRENLRGELGEPSRANLALSLQGPRRWDGPRVFSSPHRSDVTIAVGRAKDSRSVRGGSLSFSSDPTAALRSFAFFCLKNTSPSNLRQIRENLRRELGDPSRANPALSLLAMPKQVSG